MSGRILLSTSLRSVMVSRVPSSWENKGVPPVLFPFIVPCHSRRALTGHSQPPTSGSSTTWVGRVLLVLGHFNFSCSVVTISSPVWTFTTFRSEFNIVFRGSYFFLSGLKISEGRILPIKRKTIAVQQAFFCLEGIFIFLRFNLAVARSYRVITTLFPGSMPSLFLVPFMAANTILSLRALASRPFTSWDFFTLDR